MVFAVLRDHAICAEVCVLIPLDATRADEGGRLVRARVRHWLDVDRRAFMVVGYER